MSEARSVNIQILLDNHKDQSESLLSAALLARKLKVQLQGLFIEEENLLRAADLALSREVSLWSAEERHITSDSMQRILRSHAQRLQVLLEKVAAEKEIDYSFQVIRGEKVHWVKENINTVELLFMGGHDLTPEPYQPYKYCRQVAPPLVVLFDGSESSENALKIAIQIAEKTKKPLLVLLLVDGSANEEQQKKQLDVLLENHPEIMINVEVMSNRHVIDVLRQRAFNMLIFSGATELVKNSEQFRQLIYQAHYPVLLVR